MGAFREVVRRTMGFGAVVAVGFTLLYIVGGENFLSLLTSDKQVIARIGEYFWWAGADSVVWHVGIRLRWHLCRHHPVEVDALFTAVASASFFGVFFGLHPLSGQSCPVVAPSFSTSVEGIA